jgi:nicotinamidase-related amidase
MTADRVLKINPDRTALLVIDVQQALFTRSFPIYRQEQLIQTINSLSVRIRDAGGVVFIQHQNAKLLEQGTPGWQIHSDLQREATDMVVHKEHGNAFKETALHALLQEHEITTVVAAGLSSYGCVRATCLGGMALGYHVVLAADGHSSWRRDAAARIELVNTEMMQAGADVIPGDEIFRCFS